MELFQNNQNSGDQAQVVQLLLNQVKTLQDQVTQLSSKPQSAEVSVPSMPNPGQMDLKTMINAANPGQMDLKTMMNARLQGLQGVPGYGSSDFSGAQGRGGFGASDFSGLQGMGDSLGANSPSVWVSNIPEDFRDTKAIGNIFGNFGNVMKVKFSRKKPDGALVQMQEPSHATKCCQFLNSIKLPGGKITVKPSKIEQVIINPHEDSDLAKDFSAGYDHRYRDLNSTFAQTCLQRLGRPTPVLMVAGIPEDKMAELKAYIIESGYTLESMEEGQKRKSKVDEKSDEKGTPNKKRKHFAFVELASVEEAVSAVARLHNTMPKTMAEENHNRRFPQRLVFSFTTKTSC